MTTSNNRRTRRAAPPRGFALIVVVIAGVAIVAMATAIVFTAGSSKILATKTASIERSTVIADAGLERATAYAKAVIRAEGDFDKLLDPTIVDPSTSINCGAPPGSLLGTSHGLPRYSDALGAPAQFPLPGAAKEYRVVAFNGGAYLTRFDDDVDDIDPDASGFLASYTGNHPQNGCTEGPTAPGRHNRFRDRNRGVWVTVLGIYPGTDPNKAIHRTTLRRYYVAVDATPTPIVHVGHDMNLGNGNFTFCSTLGDVGVGHDMNFGTNRTDSCGRIIVGGNDTGSGIGDPSCSPRNASDCGIGPGVTNTSVAAPNIPQPRRQTWFDLGSSCNFYFSTTGNTKGLYFWDGAGARNGTPCSSPGGTNIPSPSQNTNNVGNCWVPLIAVDGSNAAAVAIPALAAEVSGASWRPTNAAVPVVGGTVASAGHAYNAVTMPNFTKPNWAAACTGGFAWPPPTPGSTTCGDGAGGDRCLGTNNVATWDGANWDITAAQSEIAVPTGVYFFDNTVDVSGWNLGGTGPTTDAMPANDLTRAQWPAMTIIVDGSVTTSTETDIWVGTGRVTSGPAGLFVSFVVGQDLVIGNDSDWAIAGSLHVGHDLTLDGSGVQLAVYGITRVGHDFNINNDAVYDVLYDANLQNVQDVALAPTPMAVRTLP